MKNQFLRISIAIKQVSDDRAIEGFATALKNCFNIGFVDVSRVIASWQQQLHLSDGDPIVVPAGDFALNLTQVCHVPEALAEQFLTGLRLDSNNKMSLHDLACRPHNMNRFLYRPILIWNIDGSDFSVIGKNSWTEAIIQLTTNAIPWGKASKEWLKNSCFKEYVHSKEDVNDSWLDDEVEEHLISLSLLYDRNVKQIRGIGHCFRIDAPDLGEIDFIIIAPAVKKIFIADCKHLLGRYDIVNQRNDYNVFAVGSTHSNSYNATLAKKLAWFNENKGLLEEHFQLKYNDTSLSFDGFNFEGIFIINSPTFYMYNSEYRIYMVNQLPEVLNGTFRDSIFFLRVGEGDNEKLISVTYPYFRKPTYIEFDHFLDDEPGE